MPRGVLARISKRHLGHVDRRTRKRSKLAAWSGACAGKAATCTIAVGGDRTATAVFAPNPPCVVPALKGRTLAGARRALTAAHCGLAAVKRAYSRRVRPGRVVSQAPPAGTKLRNGGRVSVVISRGPRRYGGRSDVRITFFIVRGSQRLASVTPDLREIR